MIRRQDSSVCGPVPDRTLCLAKTEKSERGIIPGMTLWEHSMLTGITAGIIGRCFRHLSSEGFFPDGFELVAAMHDIGKLSPIFQERIALALDESIDPELAELYCSEIGHAAVGEAFASESLGREDVAKVIAAHHGSAVPLKYTESDPVVGGEEWRRERLSFYEELSDAFGTDLPGALGSFQIDLLTGLTVVSDWISSSVAAERLRSVTPPIAAIEAVMNAGFRVPDIRKGLGFSDVFRFSPNPMQKGFISSLDGPGLYVLEAGMGEGKTEAALYASYRLLESRDADGIYFALPTRLTSMAMIDRIDSFLGRITENGEKVVSVFSGAFFREEWNRDSWFDQTRRRLLAPFCVGTVDQALLAVINCRFRELRAFALAGKVVIIDELHSYDFYTGRLISLLMEEVLALGGTVIVLSATLSKCVLGRIPGYRKGGASYPQVSGFNRSGSFSAPLKGRPSRSVQIVHAEEDEALRKAVSEAEKGAKVLWIENTVRDAQRIAGTIRGISSVPIGLLHSAFTGADRRRNEAKWIEAYTKRKTFEGSILIGTQVLEQSLDIDADLLVTRLAPADMLVQRIGRLWRHRCNDRLRTTDEAVCIVLSPREKEKGFGASAHVYSPYVLFRTEEAVRKRSSLVIPDDIRNLIDEVYSERKPGTYEENKYLLSLERAREDMERTASFAVMKAGRTVSELNAMTRMKEEAYIDVLIVRDIDLSTGRLVLADGTEVMLKGPADRIAVAGLLEGSMLSIRKSNAPERVLPFEEMRIFMPYLHIAAEDEFRMRIAVADESGKLMDPWGKDYADLWYTDESGYEICREEKGNES